MSLIPTRVNWAGATPAGTPLNPVVIVTSPLIASQLLLLGNTREFLEAAAEYPTAYAGVLDFLQKVKQEMDRDGQSNTVHHDVTPRQAAEEGFHTQLMPKAPLPDDPDMVQRAQAYLSTPPGTLIESVMRRPEPPSEPVRYAPGRVRIPRSMGSLGVHLPGRGAVND